jgi:hypothetical protein
MLLVCDDLIKRWPVFFSRRGSDTATGSLEGGSRREAAGLLETRSSWCGRGSQAAGGVARGAGRQPAHRGWTSRREASPPAVWSSGRPRSAWSSSACRCGDPHDVWRPVTTIFVKEDPPGSHCGGAVCPVWLEAQRRQRTQSVRHGTISCRCPLCTYVPVICRLASFPDPISYF